MQCDLSRARQFNSPFALKLGHCPRNRLEGEAEIICDISPRHGQRDRAGRLHAFVHFQEECRDPLGSRLASEEHHVLLCMIEIAGRQSPEPAGYIKIAGGKLFERPPFEHNYRRFSDRFRGEPVYIASFKSEQVACKVKCPDLSASVAQKLVGSYRTTHNLIERLHPLAFSVDLRIVSIIAARAREFRMA